MTVVLIADASKPSLVMTSEVFKDKVLGTVVDFTQTGKDTIAYLQEKTPDICIVDFDLPDTDGPALYEAIRKIYKGPVLITAYPDPFVEEAIKNNLFAFNDACSWVRKPVKFDDLSEKIDRFLLSGHRVSKRYSTQVSTQLISKAAGRGKRAPKVEGHVIDMSFGGARIRCGSTLKVKETEELTLSLSIPDSMPRKEKTVKTSKLAETKIKATVAWTSSDGEIGVQFSRLTDVQKKNLEDYFRVYENQKIDK